MMIRVTFKFRVGTADWPGWAAPAGGPGPGNLANKSLVSESAAAAVRRRDCQCEPWLPVLVRQRYLYWQDTGTEVGPKIAWPARPGSPGPAGPKNSPRVIVMLRIARASALIFSVMAMMIVASFLKFDQNRRGELLFDPDGPSPRDPPHSAWAKAGEGTTGTLLTPRKIFSYFRLIPNTFLETHLSSQMTFSLQAGC